MGGKVSQEKRAGITAEMVRAAISYNPLTGLMFWIAPRSNRIKVGDRATSECRGRLTVGFNNFRFEASHIAWLIYYGEWPALEVDHEDRDPINMRIENLREATSSQNCMNSGPRKNNKLQIKGENGYWATITAGGYRYDLGVYPEPWMAGAAYRIAAAGMHGEFRGV